MIFCRLYDLLSQLCHRTLEIEEQDNVISTSIWIRLVLMRNISLICVNPSIFEILYANVQCAKALKTLTICFLCSTLIKTCFLSFEYILSSFGLRMNDSKVNVKTIGDNWKLNVLHTQEFILKFWQHKSPEQFVFGRTVLAYSVTLPTIIYLDMS